MLDPHSTRLFPKNRGADGYRLTGFAARCDWVVLSDSTAPFARLVRTDGCAVPRTIFLSLRSPFEAFAYFAREILPQLQAPFVLVSGSEDVTVPRQIDRRWRPYDEAERRCIQDILAHPLLMRWFAENLDDGSHPRLSPLPLGLLPDSEGSLGGIPVPPIVPPDERPLRVLCGHRIREGEQWETRRRVTELCKGPWRSFCTLLEEDVPEPEFFELVAGHAFVLCTEGGGLDPSPKAWQSILHGAVPIVRTSPLRAAYEQLPVAFVADWEPDAISPAILTAWLQTFAPMHGEGSPRREVVRRLGIDFWWDYILSALD